MSSNRPVDFDALLQALGAADAEPPPLMKKLLADVEPARVESPHVIAAAVLAELESWLTAIRQQRVNEIPSS